MEDINFISNTLKDKSIDPELIEFINQYSSKMQLAKDNYDIASLQSFDYKYLALIEAGEILRPDSLWQFMINYRGEFDIAYSDHDVIDGDGKHIEPWFTFNWSPDFLMSQNYIGGFCLIKKEFLGLISQRSDQYSVFEKFSPEDISWRYKMLLLVTLLKAKITRVPKVLWSQLKMSEADMNLVYSSEFEAIEMFLEKTHIGARVERLKSGLVRHISWPLSEKPLVSIIIPTTGNMKYLKLCLDSIIGVTSYTNYEIILLDNGRGNHISGIEYSKQKGAKVIEANEPFNWARLNNKGAKESKGELLLFLNDDIEITDPEWLTELVRNANRHDVGVAGSLLLYPDGKIQHAGVFLVDHGGGARHILHRQKPLGENYHFIDQCTREVSANTGACIMIRKDLFNEMNGFDEVLSLVGNDIDFCLRCVEKGYRNIWLPKSKLIHHESVSRKAKPIEKDEQEMWNRWGELFSKGDHYYNPNLTQTKEDFSINERQFKNDISFDYKIDEFIKINKLKSFFVSDIQDTYGVNLIGYLRADMGVGEASRGNAKALESAGIPFGVINFEKGNPSKMTNLSFQYKEMFTNLFRYNLIHINADQLPFVISDMGDSILKGKYNIGFWAWELPEFPDIWKESFKYLDEVWVPSDFVRDSISAKSPIPVITIPHAISVDRYSGNKEFLTRNDFGIPDKAFVFLSMFDTHSIAERKNPLGSVNAFKMAFEPYDMSVCLVLKVNNTDEESELELMKSIGSYNNIIVLKDFLTRFEIDSLISQIDCYVSLHRSEGFGLGPAEAMAQGKVAMLTNWSGNTQYMTSDNCIPISYTLKKVGVDLGPYQKHQKWAEPDINEASEKMRIVSSDKGLVEEIGRNAKLSIGQNFSADRIGQLMLDRLNLLSEQKAN